MAIYKFESNKLTKVDETSFSDEGILERKHLQANGQGNWDRKTQEKEEKSVIRAVNTGINRRFGTN